MDPPAPANAPTHSNARPLPISVAIVCKNNEATIGRTLDSVRELVSEIVALDSGSTDGTIRLLERAGARVQRIEWMGHVATKQAALEACRQPWVLSLDSDESLEPELARAIRDLLTGETAGVAGARFNRKVWYAGRFLQHTFQPEPRLRLVRLESVKAGRSRWTGLDPHDRLDVAPSAGRVVELPGDLRHDSVGTMAAFMAQQIKLGQVSADAMLASGRSPSRTKLLMSPIGQVFKQIVLKGAWRDGWRGWAAAGSAGVASLAKHALHAEAQGLAAEGGIDLALPDAGNATRAVEADGSATVERVPPTTTATTSMTQERDPSAPAEAEHRPAPADTDHQSASEPGSRGPEGASHADGSDGPPKKKRRRRRRKGKAEGGADAGGETGDDTDGDVGHDSGSKRRTRRDVDDTDAEVFDQETTFRDMGLRDEVIRALDECGFTKPTYIQKQLIPPAILGRDVLGQAKTGTGKTAAFALPLLHNSEPGIPMQAIILAPTRELAIQITDEINDLGRYTNLNAVTIYGGQRIQNQVDKLEKGPEIIVGTPGRVLDMIDRGYLHFKNVRCAVLDEVDRMFDIGFRDDIRKLLRMCPSNRQTLVVSATVSGEIEDLARRHMTNPEKIVTSAGSLTVSLVEQHYLTVEGWDKKKLLLHLLKSEDPALTLVFCRLKRRVDEVAKYLNDHGIESHAIHGDMSQSKRTSTMRQFQDGKLAVLVASDVAARGIDVAGITHVVNFDLPDDPEVYVHRIGRTARAGRRGIAWTFATREQGKMLSQIEDLIDTQIDFLDYPDFKHSERPSSWRDEPTGFRPLPVVTGVPVVARNRFDQGDTPDVPKDESKREAKFPGGVVPSKMPAKRMKGRVRPGR